MYYFERLQAGSGRFQHRESVRFRSDVPRALIVILEVLNTRYVTPVVNRRKVNMPQTTFQGRIKTGGKYWFDTVTLPVNNVNTAKKILEDKHGRSNVSNVKKV